MADRKDIEVGEALRDEVRQRIRNRRRELNLSQPALGAKLLTTEGTPVSGNQISHWENGRFFPTAHYRPQLAEALDMPERDLFGPMSIAEGKSELTRVQEVEDRLSALADLLGVSDEEIERTVRRRRRTRRAIESRADRDDLPTRSLIPDQDLDRDEDRAVPPPTPLNRGRGRGAGKARGK